MRTLIHSATINCPCRTACDSPENPDCIGFTSNGGSGNGWMYRWEGGVSDWAQAIMTALSLHTRSAQFDQSSAAMALQLQQPSAAPDSAMQMQGLGTVHAAGMQAQHTHGPQGATYSPTPFSEQWGTCSTQCSRGLVRLVQELRPPLAAGDLTLARICTDTAAALVSAVCCFLLLRRLPRLKECGPLNDPNSLSWEFEWSWVPMNCKDSGPCCG